jgi:hypothetical protein
MATRCAVVLGRASLMNQVMKQFTKQFMKKGKRRGDGKAGGAGTRIVT